MRLPPFFSTSFRLSPAVVKSERTDSHNLASTATDLDLDSTSVVESADAAMCPREALNSCGEIEILAPIFILRDSDSE